MANPPISGVSNSGLDGQNSLQGFLAQVKRNSSHPASNNLYAVEFGDIPILNASSYNAWLSPAQKEMGLLLSYYANEITTPSRNLTTGSATTVGSAYNYATGTSFSSFNVQFILPKSMVTKTLFERWQQLIANDANQYVRYYDDYVCKTMRIYKMERAGGGRFSPGGSAPGLIYTVPTSSGRYFRQEAGTPQYNSVSGIWELQNVFPYNVSGVTLTNSRTSLVQINVSFYYERYRWISAITGGVGSNRTNTPPAQTAAAQNYAFDAFANGTSILGELNVSEALANSFNTGFGVDWSTANTIEGGYEGEEIIGATNFMNTPITAGIGTPDFLNNASAYPQP